MNTLWRISSSQTNGKDKRFVSNIRNIWARKTFSCFVPSRTIWSNTLTKYCKHHAGTLLRCHGSVKRHAVSTFSFVWPSGHILVIICTVHGIKPSLCWLMATWTLRDDFNVIPMDIQCFHYIKWVFQAPMCTVKPDTTRKHVAITGAILVVYHYIAVNKSHAKHGSH